ncbi:MAG: hypothetical protein Rhirs2KO_26620 [Rhizobiaceae bacterium]
MTRIIATPDPAAKHARFASADPAQGDELRVSEVARVGIVFLVGIVGSSVNQYYS